MRISIHEDFHHDGFHREGFDQEGAEPFGHEILQPLAGSRPRAIQRSLAAVNAWLYSPSLRRG
jgi:hypothetical protein